MPKKVNCAKRKLLEMAQKVTGTQVELAILFLEILQGMCATHYSGDVEVLVDRFRLAKMALKARPEDVGRMLKWAYAVRNNGEKRRSDEVSAA